MTNKAQAYYDSFLKDAIKSKEQLDSFFKDRDVRKKFTKAEVSKLKKLWAGTPVQSVADVVMDAAVEVTEVSEDIAEEVFKNTPFNYNKKD